MSFASLQSSGKQTVAISSQEISWLNAPTQRRNSIQHPIRFRYLDFGPLFGVGEQLADGFNNAAGQ
ncbi:hypothetical protein HCH15_08775 [Corynebacterium testudinoris]|uniref:hypothetical protein n=1 Tax=Corynebacterium testudinoris TaxID=136857 RepID=UPI0006410C96|nr:hypothetical protein [Corynebacterium testudinoris]MBX8996272.1 hypothetical protein [Corynebacterium testudinoris]